ncbi:hypothetical protein SVAN01_06560 [Stagonosporopsis vannaccii]|nr:hypothetical protein SVAN01_06560 [Stagonosporopsis vannaccii]
MTPDITQRLPSCQPVDTSKQPVAKGLLSLPPEILEIVFLHLDTVDDVHSLGRTHRETLYVIKRQTVYTGIIRTIIGRSWIHRYDLQLCNVLALHEDIANHFQHDGKPFPVSSAHNGSDYNEWELKLMGVTTTPDCAHGPCATCIPDAVVYDILARYQGMRALEDIWLERQLEEQDFLSADLTVNGNDLVCRYERLLGRARDFEQGDLAARSIGDPTTHDCVELNPDQRGRFYSALTFVWILNELRWVLTNFAYPSQSYSHAEILERCRRSLTDKSHNPLLDQLDQHAVFTFLYHHLLPLHSPVLQDQDSSKLPLSLNTEWLVDGAQSTRYLQLFFLAGQTYLQPPDLIDLAMRHRVALSAPYPKMMLPATTDQWIRPSNSFAFPAGIASRDYERLAQLFNTHVSLINRSSFAQTQTVNVNHTHNRLRAISNSITDLASRYFIDSAITSIEKGETYKDNTRAARDIFAGEWQRKAMWSVWWWANSEDKARAVIARWRE